LLRSGPVARPRPPLIEAPFELRQQLEGDHANRGENHDTDQDDISVEGGRLYSDDAGSGYVSGVWRCCSY
jgi:hypothetical protein